MQVSLRPTVVLTENGVAQRPQRFGRGRPLFLPLADQVQHRQGGRVANVPRFDQVFTFILCSASLDQQLERQLPEQAIGDQDEILSLDVSSQWSQQQAV